jgi:cytochrome c556
MKLWIAAAAALTLAACGSPAEDETPAADAGTVAAPDAAAPVLANGKTAAQQVSERREALKALGAAFKAANDSLRTDAPDLTLAKAAADEAVASAQAMAGWFPEGSGPESGVETEALATIWSDAAGFEQKRINFEAQAIRWQEIIATGDVAATGAHVREIGGACKACHDVHRVPQN